MAIKQEEIGTILLPEVKLSLGVKHNDDDNGLIRLIKGAIGFAKESGVNEDRILSDLGIQLIVFLVSDVWRSGGQFALSPAVRDYVSLLYSSSRADEDKE